MSAKAVSAALAVACAAFATTGCGFTPLYATNQNVTPELGGIAIAEIPGRTGFILRQEFLSRVAGAPGDELLYRLEVDASEQRNRFSITVDDVASRFELVLNTRWILFDRETNEVVTQGATSSSATYVAPIDSFANTAAVEQARERASSLAAEALITDLSFFFKEQDERQRQRISAPSRQQAAARESAGEDQGAAAEVSRNDGDEDLKVIVAPER